MFKLRALATALALATFGAAFAVAPASAAIGACSQQGFRTLVNGVWHHYVWVKEIVNGHVMYRMIDCGPAF
jgi:hypothetical protein